MIRSKAVDRAIRAATDTGASMVIFRNLLPPENQDGITARRVEYGYVREGDRIPEGATSLCTIIPHPED